MNISPQEIQALAASGKLRCPVCGGPENAMGELIESWSGIFQALVCVPCDRKWIKFCGGKATKRAK